MLARPPKNTWKNHGGPEKKNIRKPKITYFWPPNAAPPVRSLVSIGPVIIFGQMEGCHHVFCCHVQAWDGELKRRLLHKCEWFPAQKSSTNRPPPTKMHQASASSLVSLVNSPIAFVAQHRWAHASGRNFFW